MTAQSATAQPQVSDEHLTKLVAFYETTPKLYWDVLSALRELQALRITATAGGESLAEAREIIEEFCSSGYVPGSGPDAKWQERRTAWLAKGETK